MLRLKKTHIYCLEKLERALLMLKVAFEKHLKHWLWMSQERNIVTKPPAFQPSLPSQTRAAGSWEIDLGVTLESWELSYSCLTPLVCPVRALPSPGLDEGVFRISLFIPCREGKKKKRGRKKKIPHCQSNAKLCVSGMSRADAAERCQSGSPSSVPWVPINCSGARLSASSSPGRWYPGRILRSASLVRLSLLLASSYLQPWASLSRWSSTPAPLRTSRGRPTWAPSAH